MVIDERSRHELHAKLEQVLGSDEAATLMGHLPPVGWSDVATKRDLESLENKLTAVLRAEISASERHTLSVILPVVLGANFTLAGLAFAAAKLI